MLLLRKALFPLWCYWADRTWRFTGISWTVTWISFAITYHNSFDFL